MGEHLINGEFQSDKFPDTPRGLVPFKCSDVRAQDLLWEYSMRKASVDPEFSADLQQALRLQGYVPSKEGSRYERIEQDIRGLPPTWIPALLATLIETAEKKEVFREKHGISKFTENVLGRIDRD